MRELKELVRVVLAVILFVAIVTCCVVFVGEHAGAPGAIAGIERLRQEIKACPPNASEDVMGQAVDANCRIAAYQTYNKRWWAALFVPNRWDEVEYIDIRGEE